MSSDIQEMYLNLTKLLQDICTFLSDDGKLTNLSIQDRKLAEKLITRSKSQLVEISKVSETVNDPDEAYVDMERKPELPTELRTEVISDKNNIYSSVDDDSKDFMKGMEMGLSPYRDLPAKYMNREIKCGYVRWKQRLFYFCINKRVFAGIHNNWLLIYSNHKDSSKPIECLDLKSFTAQPIGKMKDICFSISWITGESKTYVFMAKTHKDMLQWVTNINKYHDESIITSKNSKIITNDYTSNFTSTKTDDYVEEVYQDIDDHVLQFSNKKIINIENIAKPPELPTRRPIIPLSELPKEESSASLASYDDIHTQSDSSFSDGEEFDHIYQPFASPTMLSTFSSNSNNTNTKQSPVFKDERKSKPPQLPARSHKPIPKLSPKNRDSSDSLASYDDIQGNADNYFSDDNEKDYQQFSTGITKSTFKSTNDSIVNKSNFNILGNQKIVTNKIPPGKPNLQPKPKQESFRKPKYISK